MRLTMIDNRLTFESVLKLSFAGTLAVSTVLLAMALPFLLLSDAAPSFAIPLVLTFAVMLPVQAALGALALTAGIWIWSRRSPLEVVAIGRAPNAAP